MNKTRIKEILNEQDLDYEGTGGDTTNDKYTLGAVLTEEEITERDLFESDILKRVTESGIAHYKTLKKKS